MVFFGKHEGATVWKTNDNFIVCLLSDKTNSVQNTSTKAYLKKKKTKILQTYHNGCQVEGFKGHG